jgi:putative membrane protein
MSTDSSHSKGFRYSLGAEGGHMLGRWIAYVIGSLVAILALGTILGNDFVSYSSEGGVIAFALVLGSLLTFIKPVADMISLPLTCLTFGLFAIVINALLFGAAAAIVPGVDLSVWGALIGSIMASIASGVIFSIVDEK